MKGKILLVEDDPFAVRTTTYKLEKEGFEVEVAWNGKEALEKIERYIPDLILLDIMLPGVDGFSVAQKLKTDERFRDIPVIAVSAKAQTSDVATGYNVGVDDYVVKPVDLSYLVTKIEDHLNRKHLNQV